MNRSRLWMAAAVLMGTHLAFAAPVRVSFLDTDATREATLTALANAGCDPANLAALRTAIRHYYQTPLALDVSAFPPAIDGFREFESIGDFVSALGPDRLSYLDHPFELNCFDTALLLAAPDMGIAADLNATNGPFFAVQVSRNFQEAVVPVASLGEAAAVIHPPGTEPFLKRMAQFEFSDSHKALEAALYQYQALPLDAAPDAIPAETQNALRRHWERCGVRFPSHLSLAMLHRASALFHLAVTDHMGVLLKRDAGWLYLEKTGGRGPFLRIDVQDPADVAAYYSTMTWPDYPFNSMSIDGETFLPVPLRNSDAPQPAADFSTAERAKRAIQRRFSEIAAEQLDDRGYTSRSELNLLPGVRLEDVQADLAQGSGQELDGKFRAAHSSSALAVNAFGPWRKHPQGLSLLGKTGFDFLQFEKQCPTGLGGIPPNLDLVVAGTDVVIGVESKFLEILAPKPAKFADSYTRENLPQMEPSWWYLMNALKAGPDQYLDAAQLVRHYLGLRNQPEYQGKKIVLLYVFWEPENWRDFPEYRRHRDELAAFQEQVEDSAVSFVWTTYPELWNQWTELGLYPGHVEELRRRYGLSI